MSTSTRRRELQRSRTGLLGGVAALALGAGAALAQEAPPAPFNLEADHLTRTEQGVVSAEGDVEGRYRNRAMRADRLNYDQNNRIITAEGDVVIVDDDGNAEFARSITVDEDFRTGVVQGFAAREGKIKFAAANAIRHSENLNELNRAIFTPCDICATSGEAKQPTWSVSADRIVQDRARKLVHYRNAVIRVKGVPVFYTPVFWHADPQAERTSGFLPPRFQQTERRGLSYEQPYLWSISPSQDLVVTPQFNTEVNPFLSAHWRKRFYSGNVEARVGYTHDRDFNTNGVEFGDTRDKAYILAYGRFDPTEDWTWGFTAEDVNDKLLFDQYSVRDIYQTRGLFLSDDRRLASQLFAVRQTQRSYLSVSALRFQSLRPVLTAPPNAFGIRPFEDDDTLPIVAPLIEARWEPQSPVLGGRLRLGGGAVSLFREESPTTPGEPGVDSARVTLEADWRSSFTHKSGVRIEPFANLRGDYYRVQDLTPETQTISRGLATIGVDLSLPLIRQFGRTTVVIEPIVQLALSPDAKLYSDIPNEDSIAFDFDDSNLFEANKSPGFDIYEAGQRLNVGLRGSADWGDGRAAQFVVGRSFRADPDPVFAARTGLNERSSDWVLAGEATLTEGLSFYTKARLGDRDLDIRRIEIGADVALSRGDGYIRYLSEDEDFAGIAREDIEIAGDIFVTQNWGLTFDAIHDLKQETWRRRSAGIAYRDECTRFDIIYQKEDNPVLGGDSADSIAVRLTLAINGEAEYRRRDRRWPD